MSRQPRSNVKDQARSERAIGIERYDFLNVRIAKGNRRSVTLYVEKPSRRLRRQRILGVNGGGIFFSDLLDPAVLVDLQFLRSSDDVFYVLLANAEDIPFYRSGGEWSRYSECPPCSGRSVYDSILGDLCFTVGNK